MAVAFQKTIPILRIFAALRRQQEFGKPVEIGSDVWVGGGAIICPDVKIGSRTVIGAGSVVTSDIPDGVFAAGNPCRVIRDIGEGVANPSSLETLSDFRPPLQMTIRRRCSTRYAFVWVRNSHTELDQWTQKPFRGNRRI